MTNEELQQEVEKLQEQISKLSLKIYGIEAKKKPYEVEVPEDIEDYYTVNRVGCIQKLNNVSKFILENMYRRGLAFKTREQAEQYDKERILLFKMHKWAEEHNGDWTPDWKDIKEEKWSVMYDDKNKELETYVNYKKQDFLKLPYYKSEEIAQQFIEEFGDEIKEVLYKC